MACNHESLFWYPAPHDETGWKCADCDFRPGEPPGYSPQHDRDHIDIKCWSILHDMVDAKLVSVSNSSHGEGLAHHAAQIARDERRFDQESIVAILARICAGDGKYWRELHENLMAGIDPRNRCKCGALATSSSCTGGGPWTHRCGKRECWESEEI